MQASCFNYNHVLVTLLGDVASNYVQVRTLQQRMAYVQANVDLQNRILTVAERRLKAGSRNAVDCHQARSTLAQTEAQIPQLKLAMRQACDRLCVLLGRPAYDLERELGFCPIPTAPAVIAIGLPCDLLRRRPDVQRAERLAYAQAEQIGIAEAALYPAFFINGTIGVESEQLNQLFTNPALTGAIGPSFQWNILNYGRIRNNMRVQEARFQALVLVYQETVLKANAEVEDCLAAYLLAQDRTGLLDRSVAESRQAADLITREYQGGTADFNHVALIEQNLVQQQDMQVQSHGDIAEGLIQLYRASAAVGKFRRVRTLQHGRCRRQPRRQSRPLRTTPQAPPKAPETMLPPPPSVPAAMPAAPMPPAPPRSSGTVPVAPMPPTSQPSSSATVPLAPMPPSGPSLSATDPVAPMPRPSRPSSSATVPLAPMPPARQSLPATVPLASMLPSGPSLSATVSVAPMPPASRNSSAATLPVAPMPPSSRPSSSTTVPLAPMPPAGPSSSAASLPVAPMPPEMATTSALRK